MLIYPKSQFEVYLNRIVELLQSRASSPKLIEPAPANAELQDILACGLRAPDHGRLKPWRLHVLSSDGLTRLGDIFAQQAINDNAAADKVEKCRNMPKRAPLLIVAVCEPVTNAKVPELEQVLAVGAAIQNMQIAISALGYASIWRTGEMALAKSVISSFSKHPAASIVGFLYVGTAEKTIQAPEIDLLSHVKYWN